MTEFIWVNDIRKHPEYYMQMFGTREVTNALGLANHHDDCNEWLLAIQSCTLLGFSGYEIKKNTFILKRSYVFPQYRRFGLYKTMLEMRIKRAIELEAKIIQATTTYMSKPEFEKRGFKALKQFKKYTTYRIIL